MNNLIPIERIEDKILFIRGQRVMLDRDLASLYGVETRQLKRQVRRNRTRFPEDFMFILNEKEIEAMVCHFGTPFKRSIGGTKPFAFTEHGILMLSSILNSQRAIEINIQIMRIFIRFRQMIVTHKKLAEKLKQLEHKYKKHDNKIQSILSIMQQIIAPPEEEKRKIGFLR